MSTHLQFDFLANKENNTLTIRREFAARRPIVWDCYTKAELLNQWFAPKPFTTTTKSMEFRDGGHWHYAMIDPSNGHEYWGWTAYKNIKAIDSYETLDAFSNEAGELNTELPSAHWLVTFSDKGQHTVVETIVTYASLTDLETIINMGMEEGMASTLVCLDELIAKKITIQADVAAPVAQVWAKYNQPEHIIQWNFATDDWQCPSAETDLRPGGKMRSRMEAKDGSFGFDFEAIYDRVVDQEAVAYTMPDGRQVYVSFDKNGDTTRVTIVFDPENQNPVEMQQQGWQAILDNFKRYAESQ
jgi:uncharacterized protein YndB with AHSA1/START domain